MTIDNRNEIREIEVSKKDLIYRYQIALLPCNALVLKHLLDRDLPNIWVRDHAPNEHLEWWDSTVPMNKEGDVLNAQVRQLVYDFQISTENFLSRLDSFKGHGLELFQSTSLVPNTFTLNSISEEQKYKLLLQNRIVNGFYLPHAVEVCMFWSFDKEWVQKIVNDPEVSKLIILNG